MVRSTVMVKILMLSANGRSRRKITKDRENTSKTVNKLNLMSMC